MSIHIPNITVNHLQSIGEITEALDALCSRKMVIVNLEALKQQEKQRVVDSLAGCIYAIDGKVTQVDEETYAFIPSTFQISNNV